MYPRDAALSVLLKRDRRSAAADAPPKYVAKTLSKDEGSRVEAEGAWFFNTPMPELSLLDNHCPKTAGSSVISCAKWRPARSTSRTMKLASPLDREETDLAISR